MEEAFDEFRAKIVDEVTDFQIFADIGIHALSDAVDWWKASAEECRKMKWTKEGIDNVKKDSQRLLSTYRKKIESNVEYCKFEGNEKIVCKKLGKLLTDSLDGLDNMNTNVRNLEVIQNNADNLVNFLEDLQDKQREDIVKKINHETIDLKQRIVQIGKQPPRTSTMETERNDDLLQSLIAEFREFKRASEQNFKVSAVETRNGVYTITEKLGELKKQNKISCGKIFQLISENVHRSLEQDSKLNCIQEVVGKLSSNASKNDKPTIDSNWRKIITGTISNVSERDKKITKFRSFKIGDIPWVIYYQWDKKVLSIWLDREFAAGNGTSYCIVTSQLSIPSQFNTEKCYTDRQATDIFKFSKQHEITFDELTKPENGYIKDDSITIEIDIALLSYSNFSNQSEILLHPSYEKITGNISTIFNDVSKLKENETLLSYTVHIGGYPWEFVMTRHKMRIYCNWEDKSSEWSCLAKIEYCILNNSKSTSQCLHTNVYEFRKNQYGYETDRVSLELILKENQDFIENDAINIQAIVTVFKQKVL